MTIFLLKSLTVWILEIWFVIHEKTQILLILQDMHFLKKNDPRLIFRHKHIFANQTSDSLTPSWGVNKSIIITMNQTAETVATSRGSPAELGNIRSLPESSEKLRLSHNTDWPF